MLIEITRFRRRYFSFTGSNSINGVMMSLILVCYATLVLIVVENRTSISPISLIMFETGLLTVFAPMMLYGAIAGERERRSWDLLLAAPITKSQIVMGKFIGAMAALAIAVLAFQLPIGIAAGFYEHSSFTALIDAEVLSISFLMCVCALTLLFSARVKRGLMALGATLGSLITFLVVVPAILGIGVMDRHLGDVTFYLHPFWVLTRISEMNEFTGSFTIASGPVYSPSPASLWSGGRGYDSVMSPIAWGLPQTFTYLGLTAILLTWASQTLNFAENDVKFLPQGQKDA